MSPLLRAMIGIASACLLSGAMGAEPASVQRSPATHDPVHDFDAFFGTWNVKHRKLKERLAGSNDWIEFDGTQTMQPVLGGQGNMTDNVFHLPGGKIQRGVTLRAFDPDTRKWSIWWLDGNNPSKIDVPVVGGFEQGSGAFYADDTFKGRPIKVRFLWVNVRPNTREWQQAFSPDGGKTWETNWVAYFTRANTP